MICYWRCCDSSELFWIFFFFFGDANLFLCVDLAMDDLDLGFAVEFCWMDEIRFVSFRERVGCRFYAQFLCDFTQVEFCSGFDFNDLWRFGLFLLEDDWIPSVSVVLLGNLDRTWGSVLVKVVMLRSDFVWIKRRWICLWGLWKRWICIAWRFILLFWGCNLDFLFRSSPLMDSRVPLVM